MKNLAVIFESILVGAYLLICYLAVIQVIQENFMVQLFVAGFIKHFAGYYLGIQDEYCRSGSASSEVHDEQKTRLLVAKPTNLFGASLVEGVVVALVGYVAIMFIQNRLLSVFVIGALMHIVAEIVGIHQAFCRDNCGFIR